MLGQQGQPKPPRKDQRDMARVNRLNKARNFQNAFQNVGARPEGARTADDGVDPFSRRKTRLVNYWTTNKQKGANTGKFLAFSASPPRDNSIPREVVSRHDASQRHAAKACHRIALWACDAYSQVPAQYNMEWQSLCSCGSCIGLKMCGP